MRITGLQCFDQIFLSAAIFREYQQFVVGLLKGFNYLRQKFIQFPVIFLNVLSHRQQLMNVFLLFIKERLCSYVGQVANVISPIGTISKSIFLFRAKRQFCVIIPEFM